MLLAVSRLLPDPGSHVLVLSRIEEITSPLDPTKRALAFVFCDDEVEISKVTGVYLRKGESLAKLIESLLGRPIVSGDSIDLERFIGLSFEVTVGPKEPRGVRIESIRPCAPKAA